tara:strand:- start:2599 stop:3015 length:417 start_codon:yes stop_codon:yes gene_type:complete
MIQNFNGIFYLLVFIVHFLAYGVYAYKCVIGTKSFLKQYGMHVTGAGIVRFFGGFFIGSILMALYILLVRDNGVQATWAFFNLVFVQNLVLFLVGNYNMFINKLGHTKKTSIEQVIAPGILTLLSAILCFGLADKIYI